MATKIKLLVADDDAILLSILQKTLVKEGFDVSPARNGSEAIAILQADPTFDLLITDLRMPVKNGEVLLNEARDLIPGIKAIVISGYCDSSQITSIFGSQECFVIAKPFKIPDLLDVIDRALAVA